MNLVCSSAAEFAQHSKVLIAKVDAAQRSAKEANERYVKEQAERRKLHNQLQEAKGNIRVFCRIRPMSSKEEELGETSVVKSNTPFEVNIIESASERAGGRLVESKSFEFDRVFGADSTQHDVFDEVQPMVISALDGFHACIFAYGQTGEWYCVCLGRAVCCCCTALPAHCCCLSCNVDASVSCCDMGRMNLTAKSVHCRLWKDVHDGRPSF